MTVEADITELKTEAEYGLSRPRFPQDSISRSM